MLNNSNLFTTILFRNVNLLLESYSVLDQLLNICYPLDFRDHLQFITSESPIGNSSSYSLVVSSEIS